MKYISIFVAVLFFTACQKNEPQPPDPIQVDSWLDAPLDGQMIFEGDTVFIQANWSVEDWELHGYEVYVYDTLDQTVVFAAAQHDHNGSLRLDTSFVNQVSKDRTVRLDIRCYLDHLGTEKREDRVFSLLAQ